MNGCRQTDGKAGPWAASGAVNGPHEVGGKFTAHCSPALEVAADVASSMARPHTRSSPVPLSFSPEEMDLLLSLAAPIDAALRSAFLAAVAEAIGEQPSGPASSTK